MCNLINYQHQLYLQYRYRCHSLSIAIIFLLYFYPPPTTMFQAAQCLKEELYSPTFECFQEPNYFQAAHCFQAPMYFQMVVCSHRHFPLSFLLNQ